MSFSDNADTNVLEQAAETMRGEQARMHLSLASIQGSPDFEKLLREQDLETLKHRNNQLAENTEILKDDGKARKIFSRWVFGFVALYVITTMVMLALNNISCHLSENVLITLLSTTTINIIGLLAAVVRYLFPHRP